MFQEGQCEPLQNPSFQRQPLYESRELTKDQPHLSDGPEVISVVSSQSRHEVHPKFALSDMTDKYGKVKERRILRGCVGNMELSIAKSKM